MTIYLIEYDRSTGTVARKETFPDTMRSLAEYSRLAWEQRLKTSGLEFEVVLLEASSEQDLHKTHGRYFVGLKEIARAASA